MNKRKPIENEQAVLNNWRKALSEMDATLKDAQICVRQLERVVTDLRIRVGDA
jgi:hypothetical protein